MRKQFWTNVRKRIVASARPALALLALAFLPACSSLSGHETFKAIAAFELPAFPKTATPTAEPTCGAAQMTDRPDSPIACDAEPAATPDVTTSAARPEVAEALGTKYTLAHAAPAPPLRPGAAPRESDLLITGSLPGTRATPIHDPRSAPIVHRGPIGLADAVAHAVLTYPEIRANEARLREAKAGIDVSRAALLPSADLRVAAGGNYSGSFEGRAVPYTIASTSADNRFDGGLVLRQLVWDFGAASADVDRAKLLSDSEAFRLREKIDEIAWKTAQTYVKIHEHRALIGLVDETIAAHQNLLRIVIAQEKEGHGTSADVNRVRSRLTDISTIRADVSLNLRGAEDQFERLTRHRPTQLGQVPNYRGRIPARPEVAIEQVLTRNPRLASMQASNRSIEKELEAQRAGNLPKLGLEIDTESKNFRSGIGGRTQMEGRGMLAMRFKLYDGGLAAAQERQIKARMEGAEMLLLNEREQFEADIRQAYRAIDSAMRKGGLLAEGVASARRVKELYIEQFKAGKRTIFELLDGQMAHYTARRAQIESQYEIHKAVIDVLRLTGELTPVLAGQRGVPGNPATPLLTGSTTPRLQSAIAAQTPPRRPK
jgi:TolC family type I secretion outer membrane protein